MPCARPSGCRLRKAGTYRLVITLRGAHIMGSPFSVLVHATEPWPPASEFYPVDPDGLRSDVAMVFEARCRCCPWRLHVWV